MDVTQSDEIQALREQVATLTEQLARARRKRYCGCAWCCASVAPDQRGEGHRICRAP